MQRTLLENSVGVALALLFAAAMGFCIFGVLLADFMQPGRLMSDHTRRTLLLTGWAGACAALVAWGVQSFAAERGFAVRFLYSLLIFVLVFFAFGGLLEVANRYYATPAARDFTVSGLYFASVSGFYSFAVFVLAPPRPPLFGLWLAAGLYVALVGPRRARN